MTPWAEVVAAAMVLIDDARLTEQLNTSPAQFYRRMALFVTQALPLLCRPPELLAHLQNGMTAPSYDDFEWTSTPSSTGGQMVVQTGKAGFDLCSVVIVTTENGVTGYAPYAGAVYDAATGNVTFPQQDSDGILYMMDFYTDGSFPALTPAQLRLFARAIQLVWDERFTGTWLNRTPKINDESFSTVNEANYTEKSSQELLRNRQAFHDELKQYEQNCAYQTAMQGGTRRVTLI